ncbi:MAG TPA: hypothetical protein VKE22_21515 [Haliangiales bacterium]|nr:hypothetical protein [Haliangiales bacterium]
MKNVVSDDLRRVLENEVRELAVAEDRGLHIAGIVLAGSIGEGLLYDALRSEKARAMAASKAPPGRGGLPKDVEKDEWKLADYINVAAELGMLVPTTQRMAHDVLRDFRNMIHPKVQVEKKLRPDASELKASIAWLEAVARDLAEYRRAKMSPSSPSS